MTTRHTCDTCRHYDPIGRSNGLCSVTPPKPVIGDARPGVSGERAACREHQGYSTTEPVAPSRELPTFAQALEGMPEPRFPRFDYGGKLGPKQRPDGPGGD